MSPSSQPGIRGPIPGCEDVTNSFSVQILRLIRAGVCCTKDIIRHLQESHDLSAEAIKQRLSRMTKSGELIRASRGVYAPPDAFNDFLPDNDLLKSRTDTQLPVAGRHR